MLGDFPDAQIRRCEHKQCATAALLRDPGICTYQYEWHDCIDA